MTKLNNHFDAHSELDNIYEVQSRKQKLEEYFQRFESLQAEISALGEKLNDNELIESDDAGNDEFNVR